jgi:hypothetical protein
MSAPLETPEFKDNDPDTPDGLYVGDYKDDDANVIDSFFIETDTPATPQLEAIDQTPLKAAVKPTRLLGDTRIINVGDQPFMLIPPDTNRKSLKMLMTTPSGSATATDYVNFADNVGNVSLALQNGTPSGVTRMRAWAVDHTLDGHTGAVWVSGSLNQTLPLEITWTAVTA